MDVSRRLIECGIICFALFAYLAAGACNTTVQPTDGTQGDGGTHVEVTADTQQSPDGHTQDATQGRPDQHTQDRQAPHPEKQGPQETPPEPRSTERTTQPDTQNTTDTPPTETAPQGTIQIFLKGDLTPQTFHDKYAGQTPTDFKVALSRYYAMTSAQDPNPQLCFDLKKPAIADLSKDNLMGTCKTQDLKTAVYTHGRVKIEWLQYTVDGIMHYNGMALPGKFTFFRAFSDTTFNGKTYKARSGWIRYSGVATVELPYTYPPMPSVSGLHFSLVNGEFFATFPYTKPLLVDQKNLQSHWARFHWKIHNAFRWMDKSIHGYQTGKWDVSTNTSALEEVFMFGASGYYITTSVW